MPKMHHTVKQSMHDNLNSYTDLYCKLNQLHITHEEYLELIAPSEHHTMLREAAKYADISASEAWLAVRCPADHPQFNRPHVAFYARTHGDKEPPLRPRNPVWISGAKVEQRVVDWVEWRLKVGAKAAITGMLVNYLSEWENGSAVRFAFPAIMHLVRERPLQDERVAKWRAKHAAFSAQRSMPAIPPSFREAIKIATEFVTACSLLPEHIDTDTGEVTVSLWGAHEFNFHGFTLQAK